MTPALWWPSVPLSNGPEQEGQFSLAEAAASACHVLLDCLTIVRVVVAVGRGGGIIINLYKKGASV